LVTAAVPALRYLAPIALAVTIPAPLTISYGLNMDYCCISLIRSGYFLNINSHTLNATREFIIYQDDSLIPLISPLYLTHRKTRERRHMSSRFTTRYEYPTPSFKTTNPLLLRKTQSKKIIEAYPGKIPIIMTRCENTQLPLLRKNRFLVPEQFSVGQLLNVLRNKLEVNSSIALFLVVNGKLVNSSKKMIQLYEEYDDEDGFLYIHYVDHEVFG
jgi:hypothetical protein